MSTMRFDVITIFPGMFAPVFEPGVVGRVHDTHAALSD